MYDPQYTKAFYNAYGEAEWDRLETRAYGRLQSIIHTDFLQRYLKPGDEVLDAGSGPGRFAIAAAQIGARVTVLDISNTQLAMAKQKLSDFSLVGQVDQFLEADITDLSMLPTGYFDSVVCFGGALSYVCEQRQKAAQELMRITRPGGFILISVMSRLGSCLIDVQIPEMNHLKEPNSYTLDNPGLWQPLRTGDLLGFPSRKTKMLHAAMHLYTAEEARSLFSDCEILENAGSNVAAREYSQSIEQIAADPKAWATLVELERKINTDPGLVNSGTHIILVARK